MCELVSNSSAQILQASAQSFENVALSGAQVLCFLSPLPSSINYFSVNSYSTTDESLVTRNGT